jgi:hypothetical protein
MQAENLTCNILWDGWRPAHRRDPYGLERVEVHSTAAARMTMA